MTGAFLAPLFEPLPQATLAAIVIVAVSGFLRVDELARFRAIRRSAIVLALVAVMSVLVLGVLQGLVVAAGLSLVYVIERLSRPHVRSLRRDPATGIWQPDTTEATGDVLVVRSSGPLFYPNAVYVREHVQSLAAASRPRLVVLDMSRSPDLDVESLDAIADLQRALDAPLILAAPSKRAAALLARSSTVPTAPTIDAAITPPR